MIFQRIDRVKDRLRRPRSGEAPPRPWRGRARWNHAPPSDGWRGV